MAAGPALILTSGFATNPGATVTNATISTGDSAAIRAFDQPGDAFLIELWTFNASGGVIRLTSPRLHDNSQGIRFQSPAGAALQYLPRATRQRVFSVDTITYGISGGAAETDCFSALYYYTHLGGASQSLVTWPQIQDQIIDYCGVELDITSGATAGQYGGARTLNQDFQNLKADYNYAVVGYSCASSFNTLAIQGPDTSNYVLGGPGSTNLDVTGDWFVRLSQYQNAPMIPVIKANNQGATSVSIQSADTATAHHVSLHLARLNS